MRKLEIVGFALWEALGFVLAVLGAPIVAAFARWDDKPSSFTGGAQDNGPLTIRGDLPRWASAWETIDERLPGGMYEEQVRNVHRRFGRYVCSVYWLIRNRMMGLTAKLFGRPLAVDQPPRGMQSKVLGPLYFGAGWKKYRATPQAHWEQGPFIEMPSVTVRFLKGHTDE
jgi:hypothetical protein